MFCSLVQGEAHIEALLQESQAQVQCLLEKLYGAKQELAEVLYLPQSPQDLQP